MGSTTYDDARDPNDATWSGASWYGPSTGEYWIINPREYADPRKHGPEYQSRARRMAAAAAAAAAARAGDEPLPDGPGDDGSGRDDAAIKHEDDREPATRTSRPRATADATAFTSPSAAASEPLQRPARPDRSGWARPAPDAPATAGTWAAASPRDIRRSPRSGSELGASPRDWIGGPADDPIRRFGVALVAWPPLGLAAAAAVGAVTGCSAYSAACDGAEPLLPWLAQAGILGLLLLLPPAARILAGGTVAVLLALVPVTAFLIAVGGSGAPQAGFALTFFLAAAWLAGIAWGAAQQLRRPRAGVAP